ncbi:tRNA wybutosine-synthesizing protein 2 homolog [Eublepharis macularius]|uniref:tRNA wybutosine-synthesizing protein 2 homolog n=1 Tax=Eublepharis macularius TaxID=481883 RepID=A0AA97LDC5_EUBMA|nr:tRNA wybutosine-synthesizing protein 2 homolog [Eublepharis macularius]
MEAEDLNACGTAAIVTEPQLTQLFRKYLEREGILDSRFCVQKLPDGVMALPVLRQSLLEHHLQHLKGSIAPGRTCALMWIQNPVPSKSARVRSPIQKLRDELESLASGHGAAWSEELEKDLPRSWQRHGDLVLLSEDSFRAARWGEMGQELWETVASALGAKRLARRGRVLSNSFRSPTVTLLLGEDGWVEQVENGIRCRFDVTRCMLSPGNITEKLRIASLRCAGEVVVDLYAGIGYFTLPYLVHAGAAFVHACEWNPHAVEALHQNLQLNGVQHRCRIHQGDNEKLELQDVANRVNLGLIPTSEEGWPVACRVLRKDVGGILHIHQNIESFPGKALQPGQDQQFPSPLVSKGKQDNGVPGGNDTVSDAGRRALGPVTRSAWQEWAKAAGTKIRMLLEDLDGKPWRTNILHIELLKSYAPHVHHIVLDLDCRPFS